MKILMSQNSCGIGPKILFAVENVTTRRVVAIGLGNGFFVNFFHD